MRKPDFCICENKDADQLCSYRTVDQRLCFCYIDSTLPKSEAIFCCCTARFVSDLVPNSEDRFSCNADHFIRFLKYLAFIDEASSPGIVLCWQS